MSADRPSRETVYSWPRKCANEVVRDVPGGKSYHANLELHVASAMNVEWWRGFYAGQDALRQDVAS